MIIFFFAFLFLKHLDMSWSIKRTSLFGDVDLQRSSLLIFLTIFIVSLLRIWMIFHVTMTFTISILGKDYFFVFCALFSKFSLNYQRRRIINYFLLKICALVVSQHSPFFKDWVQSFFLESHWHLVIIRDWFHNLICFYFKEIVPN